MANSSLLMVSPTQFREDAECRTDNAFQVSEVDEPGDMADLANFEFDGCVEALVAAGIGVERFEGSPSCPSSVFPNNWFSTHEGGTLVLYPMRALSRRGERRLDIIDWLLASYPNVVELQQFEARDMYLEGTGSLVLDRVNRIAYAAESPRTHPTLVRNWCADMEYEPVLFQTSGPGGMPIYHTNVVMSVGSRLAVVCTEALLNPSQVLSALLSTGHEILEITGSQMASFCGNCLELIGTGDSPRMAMSESALNAFRPDQMEVIRAFAEPLVASIPTIERYGGGSVRCMLAELVD